MIDAELVQLCADPRLDVEIVQQFVSEMNAPDHLAVSVTQQDSVIATKRSETIEQALQTTREWIGKADVRVGLTQYPAGLGVTTASQIGDHLFDTCENLSLGTALFGKVFRVVADRHGGPEDQAFADAVIAYRTGWFEGKRVFYADDPDTGDIQSAHPISRAIPSDEASTATGLAAAPVAGQDPNFAPMRIDLNGITSHIQDWVQN